MNSSAEVSTTYDAGPAEAALMATDAGLASVLRIAVARLRRRLAVERDPGNPVPLGAMAVLSALHVRGESTIGELAAWERVQPPSMTRTVNVLEEAGYVVRRPADTDRRMVRVVLTERGVEMVLADRLRRDEWLAGRLAGLSPAEVDVLRRAVPLFDRIRPA